MKTITSHAAACVLTALALAACHRPPPVAKKSPAVPGLPTLGRNLISNADAETVVLTVRENKDAPLGWRGAPEVRAAEYNDVAQEWESGKAGCPDGLNRHFRFALAINEETKSIAQTIDIDDIAAQVDAGALECALGGWFGGWVAGDGSAMLEVDFLATGGAKLGTLATTPPDPAALPKPENARAALVKQTASAPVPPRTRRLEVRLTAVRPTKRVDTNAVAAADNLSLVLREKSAAP